MALSQATLKSSILDLLANISRDPDANVRRAAAASDWADAFDAYGAEVENINGDVPLSGPNKAGFQAALSFTGVTAAAQAQEFASAWTAYFAGTTFGIGVPGSINGSTECPNLGGNLIFGIIASSLITVVNSVTLLAQLTAHFQTFRGTDREAAADTLAGIFHSNTILASSLTVLTSGTDTGGPVPITNTCRVF